MDLLAERGIAVPPEAEARIRAERDTATLRRWTARAVACVVVDELFAWPRYGQPCAPGVFLQ